MSSVMDILLEMGFSKPRAEKAINATSNKGLEEAMEWLLAHNDDPSMDDPLVVSDECTMGNKPVAASQENPASDAVAIQGTGTDDQPMEVSTEANTSEDSTSPKVAKSFRCDECGKLMETQLELEYHAAKSGHSQFSESTEEKKPLTEEEKRAQLKKVEELMRQKRLEREEKEKKEAIEHEKQRIQSGKMLAEVRKKMEEDEIKRLADLKRREKEEEKKARQRVKDQIEQDKLARKAKFGQTADQPQSPPAQQVATPPSPATVAQPKEYTEARLQIRLTDGKVMTQSFAASECLAAVRLYITMNRTDGGGAFNLGTNFPRKVFTEEDYQKPLQALGLVPSAVLIVSRA